MRCFFKKKKIHQQLFLNFWFSWEEELRRLMAVQSLMQHWSIYWLKSNVWFCLSLTTGGWQKLKKSFPMLSRIITCLILKILIPILANLCMFWKKKNSNELSFSSCLGSHFCTSWHLVPQNDLMVWMWQSWLVFLKKSFLKLPKCKNVILLEVLINFFSMIIALLQKINIY